MKFSDLYKHINCDTDIIVVKNNIKIAKIKRNTFWEDIDFKIMQSIVKGITGENYRTIEVQVGDKE